MREISVDKVTLNIGTGEPGPKLEKAMKLLGKISGRKPVATSSNKRIPNWGVRPGLQIGCKVTIRGGEGEEILKRLLRARNNELSIKKFDNFGNFSFGVPEYLDIPEMEYDADIGIIGLEVAVTLKRKGFRIKERRIKERRLPKKQRISREESIEYMKNKFGLGVEK